MPTVVLVHGWGYDASIWDAVRTRLAPSLSVEALDLGYFGAVPPAPTFSEPVLAVGHSLGALWWLAQTEHSWRRLLCINGFPRFTATEGYVGVAPRVLARMRQQFEHEPVAVLADFHARSGAPGPQSTPATARLAAGLGMLAELDARATLAARAADIFALAGAADPIVPPAMSTAAFASCQLEFIDAPGHMLPLTHPERCAQLIERLAA